MSQVPTTKQSQLTIGPSYVPGQLYISIGEGNLEQVVLEVGTRAQILSMLFPRNSK